MKRTISLLMCICLLLCGCSAGSATSETTVPVETVSPEIVEAVANSIKKMLTSENQTCEVSYDQTGITATVAMQDCSVLCAFAQTGDAKMVEAWDTVVGSFLELAGSVTELVRSLGMENILVTLNLVNETNPDDYLIITTDGNLRYDAVNGIAE